MITCKEAKDAVKRAKNWEQLKDILDDIENSIIYRAKQGEDHFFYPFYDCDDSMIKEVCRTLINNGFSLVLFIQKNRPRYVLKIVWRE